MALVLDGTNGLSGVDGSASTPSVQGSDSNTGVFYPAADTVAIGTGGSERMRVDSSGNLTINNNTSYRVKDTAGNNIRALIMGTDNIVYSGCFDAPTSGGSYVLMANGSERARITSDGVLLIGKTATGVATNGIVLGPSADNAITRSSDVVLYINRNTNDGDLIVFRQDNTTEGTISVSGTTVSYNGGNLARFAQLTVSKDETNLLKGTVMSNLDEMNVYINPETGEPVPNEQLNKVKVSDVEGDPNVAGVFVNWSYDEQHLVDEINMAMTGDMIIRIAQGVIVQKGDLLMSAGDGTAKPQEDDIIRSKTVAKVTSNHVTCTYEDGSYCVPCVLMAC